MAQTSLTLIPNFSSYPRLSPDYLSSPVFSTVKKILFRNILCPFVDLLNRPVLALVSVVKILKAIFFNWLSCVYQILCNSIDKLLIGRTIPELKKEVNQAQDQQVIHAGQIKLLDEKFGDPSKFMEDLESLKKLKEDIQSNVNTLIISPPDQGAYSVQDLIFFYLPEDPIKLVLITIIGNNHTLLEQLEEVLENKLSLILEIFKQFMKEAGKAKSQEILSAWRQVTSQIPSSLKFSKRTCLEAMERDIRLFLNIQEKTEIVPSLEISLPSNEVKNAGNTCYLAAALQAVLAIPSFREQIARPIPQPSGSHASQEYESKIAIQQALSRFMSEASSSQNNEESERVFLYSRNLLEELRAAVHHSSSTRSEFNIENQGRQLDAVAVVEILAGFFFENCQFQITPIAQVDKYPNIEVLLATEEHFIWQMALDKNKHQHKFEELVHLACGEEVAEDFTLRAGQKIRFIDPNQPVEKIPREERFDQHRIRRPLDRFPPVLITHFKRGQVVEIPEEDGKKSFRTIKLNDPIELTQDGMFYFTPSQVGNPSLPPASYKLTSFIVQESAEVESGHYVSYVEIQGKFYFCDDRLRNSTPYCYRKISQADFLSTSQSAYLCIWERFPPQS